MENTAWLFTIIKVFLIFYSCVWMCVCMNLCEPYVFRSPEVRRYVGSPETGSTGSCEPPCKVPGVKPRSSARAVSTFTLRAISLTPVCPKFCSPSFLYNIQSQGSTARVQGFLRLNGKLWWHFDSLRAVLCVSVFICLYAYVLCLCTASLVQKRGVSSPRLELQGTVSS